MYLRLSTVAAFLPRASVWNSSTLSLVSHAAKCLPLFLVNSANVSLPTLVTTALTVNARAWIFEWAALTLARSTMRWAKRPANAPPPRSSLPGPGARAAKRSARIALRCLTPMRSA